MRSRLAWLKSMKMRSPRSSFHQFIVTLSGIRRSSSRAAAMTAWRTSRNSCVGSIGQKTWMPRLPLVLTNAVSPASASTSRSACAAGTASAKSVPGCGSRSMRSSTGLSVSPASDAHGWNTIVFICTAQTIAAGLGEDELRMPPPAVVRDRHRLDEGGRALRRVLGEERLAVDASGKRSSETGRSPLAARNGPRDGDRSTRRARAW